MTRICKRRALLGCALGAIAMVAAPASAQLVTITDLANDLLSLDSTVTGLGTTVNTLAGTVATNGTLLNSTVGTVNALTGTVTSLNGTVTSLNGTVNALNGTVNGLTGTVGNLADSVNGVAGTVNGLAGTVAANGGVLNGLVGDVSALTGQVATNGGILNGLVGDVSALTGQVTANVGDISLLNTQVGGLITQTGGNTGSIVNLTNLVNGATASIGDINVRLDADASQLLTLDTRVTSSETNINLLLTGRAGLVQQASASAPITVGAATGGTEVNFAGTAGDRRLSGVAAGVAADDAVNVGQLAASSAATLASANTYSDAGDARTLADAKAYTDMRFNGINRSIRRRTNAVGASSAALAGLTQSIVPGQGMVTAGIGGRGEEVAFGLGLSKAFQRPHTPVIRAGATVDTGSGALSYNAAVGIHF